RNGLSISKPVPHEEKFFVSSLTAREKQLTGMLVQAGRDGDWSRVVRLWRKYSGNEVPVYCAAMQAAFYCGQFASAAKMYKKLRGLPGVKPNSVLVHRVLKIFGKLEKQDEVNNIWSEAVAEGLVDRLVAAARIEAAASMGDIEGAASGLDFMIENDLHPEVPAFNAAINACAKASPPSPSAAVFIYQSMLKRGLQPTIVTFTSLARAHLHARCASLKTVRSSMNESGMTPDKVFAEAYLAAIFGGNLGPAEQMSPHVAQMSTERQHELHQALKAFKASKAMSGLCNEVHKAVRLCRSRN
ncbi:unnamed protein product, partial [Symbiodinium pilosum]